MTSRSDQLDLPIFTEAAPAPPVISVRSDIAWLGILTCDREVVAGTRVRNIVFHCGCYGHWFPDGQYLPWEFCWLHRHLMDQERYEEQERGRDDQGAAP